jgi:actin-related protein
MTGGLETDIFLGSQAEEYRGLLNIRYPMEHGIVKDWNDMEKIWHHVYSKHQLNSNPEEVKLNSWLFSSNFALSETFRTLTNSLILYFSLTESKKLKCVLTKSVEI